MTAIFVLGRNESPLAFRIEETTTGCGFGRRSTAHGSYIDKVSVRYYQT